MNKEMHACFDKKHVEVSKKVCVMAIIFYLTAGLFLLPGAAFAKDITFEALLDRNAIYMGENVQLNLRFEGTTDIPAPELPNIDGIQSRYAGPSTMMSIVNTRMTSSITHIYVLVPLKTGKFQIPPITVQHKGETYTSAALTLEVSDSASKGGGPATSREQRRPEINLQYRVTVKMQAEKTKVYLNEMVPLSIKLYINRVGLRDVQYPELKHEHLSASEFEKPVQYQETRGGVNFDVVEFKTQIFATKAGDFRLGPAKIKANLLSKKNRRAPSSQFDNFFDDDFFGGYEVTPIELKSNELTINVLPFPDRNRPDNFKGAVGDFKFNMEASPSAVKVGDPVTVKMIVSGKGNFNTVTGPVMKQQEGFKTYEPQVKQEGDKKIFEQVLIPITDTVRNLPEASFSFFNPDKGQYQTLAKNAIPLQVIKAERENSTIMEAPQTGGGLVRKEVFGRDIIYIKEAPGELKKKGGYLYKNPFFLLLQIVPLLALVSAWILQKRKAKLSTDIGYARRLSAPKKAKKGIQEAEDFLSRKMPQEFYDSVFRTIREYLGNRFHIPAGGITADVVENALKEKNIDSGLLSKMKNIFASCDMARYAPAELGAMKMDETLKDLREVIDYLERHKE
ncbi:MAG: protein BatD [Nitrospirae bacterium]|nr:protein BatD [Nitrospirota bacterium]